MDSTKSTMGHVKTNLCFYTVGICGSHSALHSVRDTKHRRTIFLAWVGPVRIPKKARRDMLRQTCVLRPVGSAGHLVHCVASGT
jgi:hypothetical protein